MPEIEVLHQMIQEAVKVPLEPDEYDVLTVTLAEPQCPDSVVHIRKMPEQAVVISLDEHWALEGMFTHEKGQCKRADYVIIADTGVHKVIIYIEIKRASSSRTTVVQQLTGARCFVAYCRELARARAFWDQPNFLEEYVERFVYIGQTNTRINKRPTRMKPESGVHNCPEKLLKLTAPHYVTLQRLI